MKHLLFILLTTGALPACAQDYTAYYAGINKAEEQAYLKEDIAAGLKTYITTFNKYDFVFVHDCFEAMQLALFVNDERSFLTIANKATLNGWQPGKLSNMMSYVKKHPIFIKDLDTLMAMYRANRPHYLARIDTAALKKIYMLHGYDQFEKNNMRGESEGHRTVRYRPQIQETMEKLRQLVGAKGWLSDKLLGLDQDGIMHELNTGIPEMKDFYQKHKDDDNYSASVSQFTFDEYSLSNIMMIPMTIHYGGAMHPYTDRKRYLLYPDSFYRRQIILGNMHPKDFGLLNDYGFNDTAAIPDLAKGEKYFSLGLSNNILLYHKPERVPDAQLDAIRKAWFMGTIEVKRAKILFIQKNRMFIGWGWVGCRV